MATLILRPDGTSVSPPQPQQSSPAPWEKFSAPQAAEEAGPWTKYAAPKPSAPSPAPSSGPAMNPGHAPTFGDQAMDSARFLGNEVQGLGHALNPINMAKSLVTTGPVDMAKSLYHLPGQMVDQFKSGDMTGLAQNFGGIAAAPIAGKALPALPELPGAIREASVSPVGQGLAAAGRAAAPALLRNIPIVGKAIGAGMDAYKAATEPPAPQTAPIPPVRFGARPEPSPLPAIPRVKYNPQPKAPKPMAPIPPVRFNEPPEAAPLADVPPVQYNEFSKFIGQPRPSPLPKPEPVRTAAIPAVQWHPSEPPSQVQILPRPPKPAPLRTVRPPQLPK